MSKPRQPEKQSQLASLEAKVRVYCSFSGASQDLAGLPEYAEQLREEGDIATLRAVAKEVDTWLREIHTIEQQAELLARMKEEGVLLAHLPASRIDGKMRSIVKRGRVSNNADAELLRAVLFNPSFAERFSDVRSALSQIYDRWSVKQ
jgi:hypothetical protein